MTSAPRIVKILLPRLYVFVIDFCELEFLHGHYVILHVCLWILHKHGAAFLTITMRAEIMDTPCSIITYFMFQQKSNSEKM